MTVMIPSLTLTHPVIRRIHHCCFPEAVLVALRSAIWNAAAISFPSLMTIRLGTIIHNLNQLSTRIKPTSNQGDVPIRYNPIHNQVGPCVMSDGAEAAVVLLRPVQNRFREGHSHSCETNEGSRGPARDVCQIHVCEIHECLNDIE